MTVLFLTQGAILHHNQSAGIILSNQSLVLQRVGRPSRGNYSCRAVNQQGIGYSNEVLLEIMCKLSCTCQVSVCVFLSPVCVLGRSFHERFLKSQEKGMQ